MNRRWQITKLAALILFCASAFAQAGSPVPPRMSREQAQDMVLRQLNDLRAKDGQRRLRLTVFYPDTEQWRREQICRIASQGRLRDEHLGEATWLPAIARGYFEVDDIGQVGEAQLHSLIRVKAFKAGVDLCWTASLNDSVQRWRGVVTLYK